MDGSVTFFFLLPPPPRAASSGGSEIPPAGSSRWSVAGRTDLDPAQRGSIGQQREDPRCRPGCAPDAQSRGGGEEKREGWGRSGGREKGGLPLAVHVLLFVDEFIQMHVLQLFILNNVAR